MNKEDIEIEIKKIAEKEGFDICNNPKGLIRLKSNMEDWRTCPCEPNNNERFCCSQLCQSDVRALGKCHCGLFLRRKDG